MAQKRPKSIQSVSKSYDIVKNLLDIQPAGVSDVAGGVDLHPSTAHAHLTSLVNCGLVVKEGTQYKLSLEFLGIGRGLRNDFPIYAEGKKEIEQLAEDTGEMRKAMLAGLSSEEVDEIVDEVGLPEQTSETITKRSELAGELETIREQRYAIDANELYDGIYCIAASITRDDELAGAISVTGPTNRFSDEEYRDRQSPYLAAGFRYRPTRIRL